MLTLVVTSGSRTGERLDVSRELIVGREDADLCLEDPRMSRQHLSVAPAAGEGVEIRDLDSRNGTRVDDRRIDGSVTVTGPVTILVGSTTLELQVASGATVVGDSIPAAAPPPPPPEPVAAPPPPPPAPAAAPVAAAAAPGASFGTHPPTAVARRRRGVATRALAPATVSALAIVATAVALVLYFAMR